MEIISMKRANGFLYAYRAGRFWVWNDEQHAWKESHLMAKKYALNHKADKLLTPEDFLTDPAVFSKQDVAELPKGIVGALQRAQPCQNAPIEPVKETAAAPAVVPEEKPLTTIPDGIRPAFDYSGLDAQTVEDLHFAETEYQHGKKLAERGLIHMGDAIAVAHDALCRVVANCDNSKHGNRGEDTFRAWCVSIGITKDTAYRLLQVSALMDNSSPRQQKVLQELSPSLLYAVAKPSAPAELVEQVKSGDITTHKQYQDALAQIKAEKERADAAEAREEEAWNMVSKAQSEAKAAQENLDHEISQNDALHEEKGRLLRECEAAKKARADAEDKASAAEGQLEAATADVQGLAKENAKLHAEKEQAENRARKAEDALKHQPITAVVDEEEVDRRAHQQAYSIAADMTEELKAEKAQLQKEVDTLRKSSAQLERRMKAMTNQMDDLGQTDFDTANYFANAVLSLWNSCRGSYSRLTGEDLESTFQYICKALNDIREEAARLCRQPEGYEGGNTQ